MESTIIKKIIAFFNLQIYHAGADELVITEYEVNRPGLQLAGFYNYFNTKLIQIFGKAEIGYLDGLTKEKRMEVIDTLLSHPIPCVIIANKNEVAQEFITSAKKYGRWLLWTDRETSDFKVDLTIYLQNELAESIQYHATLIEVFGVGVLITGESGVGKSETALALIQNNHILIADDSVVIKRPRPDTLIGGGTKLTKNLLEIRGIGIIDIRSLYGLKAIRTDKKIDIVINLEKWDETYPYDRLGDCYKNTEILGVKIPIIKVPVRPGRTIASIIEAAAINFRQNELGINTAKLLDQKIIELNSYGD